MNILNKLEGKYIYKSVRLILLLAEIPIIIVFTMLLIFVLDRIFEILRIIYL